MEDRENRHASAMEDTADMRWRGQTCDGEDRRVVEGVGKAPVARVVSNRKERCGEKRAGTWSQSK